MKNDECLNLNKGNDGCSINKIKENLRKYLKSLGYKEHEMNAINDIVSIDRPGVVLIKEKIMGVYTGKLMEMYL